MTHEKDLFLYSLLTFLNTLFLYLYLVTHYMKFLLLSSKNVKKYLS